MKDRQNEQLFFASRIGLQKGNSMEQRFEINFRAISIRDHFSCRRRAFSFSILRCIQDLYGGRALYERMVPCRILKISFLSYEQRSTSGLSVLLYVFSKYSRSSICSFSKSPSFLAFRLHIFFSQRCLLAQYCFYSSRYLLAAFL